MDDRNHEPAQRLVELDPTVQELLNRLDPENVDTLKYISSIPRDELKGMMKMYRDMKAVGWFMRWVILTLVAIFIGAVTIGENIVKVIGWIKGAPQ